MTETEMSEAERLAALRALDLLDTPPEAQFDGIVHDVVARTGAPIAMISLVDDHRQWFKSSHGVDHQENPIAESICAHAMRSDGVFVVDDAREDARFRDIPAVRADGGIRFYAGAPLTTADGARLGTLCIIDTVPRDGLADDDRATLESLARRTVAAFELRRAMRADATGDNPDAGDLAPWLAQAATLLERAAVALERAGATAPLAHLEHVIAMVEAERGAD